MTAPINEKRGFRLERVNNLIKEELGKILLKEINLEQGIMATITQVKTSPNLQQSKVFLSIFPSEKAKKILIFISKKIFQIQQILNKKLNMRPVPRIEFVLDKAGEKWEKIEKILWAVKDDKGR